MIPGELLPAPGELELNAGRAVVKVLVANAGDRPIQVGSHFHFAETNAALQFDRGAARGFRLNIAAGTAVRFEPGQQREVELVALAGDRIVYGFNAAVMGALDAPARARKALKPARSAKAGKPATTVPAARGAKPSKSVKPSKSAKTAARKAGRR